MTTINNLSTIDSVAGGDQVPVFDESAGTARKMSISQLLAYFAANFASPEFEVQTAAPTLSGFTMTLTASVKSIWAVLSPTGAFATGTIVLPPVADCFDGQTIIVTSGQAITALTVNGNGATVNGAPSGLGTNGFFQLRYHALTSTWWCVAQSLGSTTVFDDITITGDILDANGNVVISFSPVASAVNYVEVQNASAGLGVAVSAAGSDANIEISIAAKGTGTARIVGGDVSIDGDAGVTIAADTGPLDFYSAAGTVDISGGDTVTISATGGSNIVISPGGDTIITRPVMTGAKTDIIRTGGAGTSTVGLLNVLYPPATNSGGRTVVVDSNATLAAGLGNVVAGGGVNIVPVYCDGTDWRIG